MFYLYPSPAPQVHSGKAHYRLAGVGESSAAHPLQSVTSEVKSRSPAPQTATASHTSGSKCKRIITQ